MNVLEMSISAGVLILIIILLRTFTIHKFPKKMFIVLWGLAILRLLIPFTISYQTTYLFSPISEQMNSMLSKSKENLPASTDILSAPFIGEGISTPQKNIPFFQIIWIVGVMACSFFFLLAYLREYRKLREGLPFKNNEYLDKWVNEIRLKRGIRILYSDRIRTPITYGIFSPKIVLPQIMDLTDYVSLKYVLEHELIHIKRLDNLWKIVALTALCIHWFNPLVWIMYFLFNRDLELSCDEKVIAIAGVEQKQKYALTLIKLAEKKSGTSFLNTGFGENAIKERVVAIMKYKKATLISLFCIILLASIAAVFVFSSPDKNSKPTALVDKSENTSEKIVKNDKNNPAESTGNKIIPDSQKEITVSGTETGASNAETTASTTQTAVTGTDTVVPQSDATDTLKKAVKSADASAKTDNSYIFPTSNSERLYDHFIREKTMAQLELGRNEIFARHGRIFKDTALHDYFNKQAWYKPSIEPEVFDTTVVLNEYEQANLQNILSVEAENSEVTNGHGFMGVLGDYSNGSAGRRLLLEITDMTVDSIRFNLGIDNDEDRSDSFSYTGNTGTIINDTRVEADILEGGFSVALDWSNPGSVIISCIGCTVPERIDTVNNQLTLWNSRYLHTS